MKQYKLVAFIVFGFALVFLFPFGRQAAADTEPSQVVVETRIVETTDTSHRDFGVNFGDQGIDRLQDIGRQDLSAGAVRGIDQVTSGSPGTGLALGFGEVAGMNPTALLQALKENGQTDVLQAPKILTVNREEATIQNTAPVEYQKTGIQLEVTPQITDDGMVRMNLVPTVTERPFTIQVPQVEMKTLATRVLLMAGTTAVLGGQLSVSNIDMEPGIPGLSQIPIVSFLFKNKGVADQKTELIIIVTPHIVHPAR